MQQAIGCKAAILSCVQDMCCFNLLRDKACCPLCSVEVPPITCAFTSCTWLYDGCKMEADGSITSCSSDWQVCLA